LVHTGDGRKRDASHENTASEFYTTLSDNVLLGKAFLLTLPAKNMGKVVLFRMKLDCKENTRSRVLKINSKMRPWKSAMGACPRIVISSTGNISQNA
jgi:hypothetical protein